jgi:TPR repeat protein
VAAPTAARTAPQSTQTAGPRRFAGEENLITLAELERYDWQALAVRLDQRLGGGGATLLQEKAATGDPAAKLELCIAHLQGIAGLSRTEAHAPCAASAAQAHPAGQYLAWMLRERANIDYDDARRYLIAAADQNWAPAQRLLASFHRNRQESFTPDATRERALLSSAAAEGYPRAMFDYASLYLRRGSEEDRTLAKSYLQRVMDDREFGLCAQARRVLVQMGDEPPACRR